MAWIETVLLNENFENTIIPVKFGMGNLYRDNWLYGGELVKDWLRPLFLDQIPTLVIEDFEDPNWVPTAWVEGLLLTENFEDPTW